MAIAVILAILLGMAWLSARQPRAAFLVAIFLIPWGGLDFDAGLRLTGYQLALLPLCLVMLVRATQPGWSPPRLFGGGLLAALALYAIVWSLLQVGFIPILKVGDGALRGPMARAILQILLFVFSLAPVVLAPILLRDSADVRQALRIYLVSLIVLAFIGWVQILSWYGLGYNPIPVGAVSIALGGTDAYIREGRFIFDSLNIYRMNSFAGEPRNLATALVLGMLIVQAIALATPTIPGRRLAAIWGFLFLSTVATFSTSGAVIWAVGTALLLPIMLVFRIPIQRSGKSIMIGGLAIVMPVIIGIVVAEAQGVPVLNLIAERTFDRLDSAGAVEDFDLTITQYLLDRPASIMVGTGLGNAHLYAAPYLDPIFAAYAEGQVFAGKTSVVRIISEIGLIGMVLFLAWYLWLAINASLATSADPQMAATLPIALVTLASFLATNQIAGETWLLGGVMTMLCASRLVPERAPGPRPAPSVT
jgi:hypothetical protein